MSTEELSFLASIADAPDDDTPRKVFADWLEEHGQEDRASLIRHQCETRLECPVTFRDGVACVLPNEETWLGLTGGGSVDLPVLSKMLSMISSVTFPADVDAVVARGFVSKVVCGWDEWQAHGDSILADPWTPGLDEVELTDHPTGVPGDGLGIVIGPGGFVRLPIAGKVVEVRNDSPEDIHSMAEDFLNRRWHRDGKQVVRKWAFPPNPRPGVLEVPMFEFGTNQRGRYPAHVHHVNFDRVLPEPII